MSFAFFILSPLSMQWNFPETTFRVILQQVESWSGSENPAVSLKPDIREIRKCEQNATFLTTMFKDTIIFHRNVIYVNMQWVLNCHFKINKYLEIASVLISNTVKTDRYNSHKQKFFRGFAIVFLRA